jgi:hypothetical protein
VVLFRQASLQRDGRGLFLFIPADTTVDRQVEPTTTFNTTLRLSILPRSLDTPPLVIVAIARTVFIILRRSRLERIPAQKRI